MPFGVLERQGVAHLGALGRACSAWWDPIPRGGDCHQWCGYPQPPAGPTCPTRGLGPHYCATCASVAGVAGVNHRVCHANTHMALKLVHHLQHTSTQSCLATRPPSISPLWTHSSIGVSHPLFRMRCTAATHSSRTFPFSLAPLEFTAPRVHVYAASRATFSIGWRRVRATTAGDLPVAALPLQNPSYHIYHIYKPT